MRQWGGKPPQPQKGLITIGKYDAQSKWAAAHTTRVVMNLNHNTDADILQYLESVPSKQGAIKEALRKLIASVTSTDEK